MITPINLNHAKSNAIASGWQAVLLLLGCAFASILCWHYFSVKHEISILEAELLQLTQSKKDIKTTKAASLANVKEDTQAKAIQLAWSEINIPWAALFKALESANGENIKLLSFEPNASTQQVRITAIAFNVDAMMAYMNRLNSQAVLRQVRIGSHETTEVNGTPAIAFHVEAQWRIK